MADNNAWDLGGGGQSFPFDRIGDEVEGHVVDMDTRQGTDMQTDKPEWWDAEQTRPKLITLLTLQTAIRDNAKDSGLRTVTLAGSKKPNIDGTKSRMCAARTAVLEATGGTAFEPGAWFKMRFTSEGARTRPNFNPPKGFDAWYRSPAPATLDLDAPARSAANSQTDPWSINPATNMTSNAVNTVTGEIRQNQTGSLTAKQVKDVGDLVGEDGIAAVFGANWRDRVVE